MDDWSSVRLCDVVNLILSGVLFFSPWLFDLSTGRQWQTASIVGIIIAVLSIAALAAFAVWEEWFILIAGLALIVSPWLHGLPGQRCDDHRRRDRCHCGGAGGDRSLADCDDRPSHQPIVPSATELGSGGNQFQVTPNEKGDFCVPFFLGSGRLYGGRHDYAASPG